jgi:hypothetical protein
MFSLLSNLQAFSRDENRAEKGLDEKREKKLNVDTKGLEIYSEVQNFR